MLIVLLSSAVLWAGTLAARAAWRLLRAVPKRNADFGWL
jgi:hypothetical protein